MMIARGKESGTRLESRQSGEDSEIKARDMFLYGRRVRTWRNGFKWLVEFHRARCMARGSSAKELWSAAR